MYHPKFAANLEPVSIPQLMGDLGINTLQTDFERQTYLRDLTPERFLGDIALISSRARNVAPEQNSPEPSERVVIFITDEQQQIEGIRYIAPKPELGRQALLAAHIQLDGNGATARFYHNLLVSGYNGQPIDDSHYQKLLSSQSNPGKTYTEHQWRAAYAQHLDKEVTTRYKLPYTPAGHTIVKWQNRPTQRSAAMEARVGAHFAEENFSTALGLEFIAQTGRELEQFVVEVDGKKYVNTVKLMHKAKRREFAIIPTITDRHKVAYLHALNEHFATGNHPAFQDMDLTLAG